MLKQVPQKVPQLLIKNHLVNRHLAYATFSRESVILLTCRTKCLSDNGFRSKVLEPSHQILGQTWVMIKPTY
jgi:hypothetical protein